MPDICLCLTGSTIRQNLAALEKYRDKVDLVELRADYLDDGELFHLRSFPEKAGLPCILTVRRRSDGGRFDMGEGVRLVIFARGLAFADAEARKNYAFIDVEYDFHIPSIQEAARTFGTRIIRSKHCMDGLPLNIDKVWRDLSARPYEIPKLAVSAKGLRDIDTVFRLFDRGEGRAERVVVGMGEYGFCTRVLAQRLGSMLVYASAKGAGLEPAAPGQLEPLTLLYTYSTKKYDGDWNLYGIVGGPAVIHSLSPTIHNAGFSALGLQSLYLPFPADDIEPFLALADRLDVQGFSITVPFKEKILPHLSRLSAEVEAIGACNTAIREGSSWVGYNTDSYGFSIDVRRFLGVDSLKGLRTTIIGAGGAARAVAYALVSLGATACVINRNMSKAKHLANRYGFEWSGMTERAADLMERYNDLIVQTTSVGLEGGQQGDPIEWYEFSGKEALYETIYSPTETQVMRRAKLCGCRVSNGLGMLKAQAEAQFSLFTGINYPLST
ncbi:MAG: type I 3-dehydroquinate dehydratase [Spirochaetia bacterium]|nr:type I 3-dehydroquinate dehydratase [Spirochaetia bacterium]